MGGRGGGRGRGRGGLGFQRHDIQLAEDERTPDIPLLYPDTPGMPPVSTPGDELDPKMQRLLKRLNGMRAYYTKSPYHMNLPQEVRTEGSVPDVMRHLDADKVVTKAVTKQNPLAQVVYMHVKYLPAELYSQKDQKRSMSKRKAAFIQESGRLQEEALEVRLKALAAEDAKAKENGEDGDDEAGKGPGKDGEEEAEVEEDDDDDLDHDDDDYYQGEEFQDDEEYGDDDDGGGGDEPYF